MSHLDILKEEGKLRKKIEDNQNTLKQLWLDIQKLNNEHSEFLDDLEIFLKSYTQ